MKVFDSYIESYFRYPRHMEYRFIEQVPDYVLNVSVPGLFKYEVANQNQHKPTISMIGLSDHLINFTFKNVEIKTDTSIIYGQTINLEGSGIHINGALTRIDIFDEYISLNIPPKSNSRLLDIGSTKIYDKDSVLNIKLEANDNLVISKNTDTVSSSIKLVIAENTRVSIKGHWSEEDGKKVTISNPDSVSNAVVDIDQPDNVFAYEGSKPKVSNLTKFPSTAIYIIVGGALYFVLIIVITVLVIKKIKGRILSDEHSTTTKVGFVL